MRCERCQVSLVYVMRGDEEFFWREAVSRPGDDALMCEQPDVQHVPDWDGDRYVADL